MPYKVFPKGSEFCVYKHDEGGNPVGEPLGCHPSRARAMRQMRALYAAESGASKASGVVSVLEATVHRSFTVAADLMYGVGLLDREQRISLSNAIGDALMAFAASAAGMEGIAIPPDVAAEIMLPGPGKKSVEVEALLAMGVKALYDQGAEQVWCGVSHNAWIDRSNDIIPLALIESDIAWQKAKILSGQWKQFGDGLWVDHDARKVIGDCQLREVLPGGRSCFEMGRLASGASDLSGAQMSIGYRYYARDGEYLMVHVYERSALTRQNAVNARTFFRTKRREMVSDAALQEIVDQVSAATEE